MRPQSALGKLAQVMVRLCKRPGRACPTPDSSLLVCQASDTHPEDQMNAVLPGDPRPSPLARGLRELQHRARPPVFPGLRRGAQAPTVYSFSKPSASSALVLAPCFFLVARIPPWFLVSRVSVLCYAKREGVSQAPHSTHTAHLKGVLGWGDRDD